MGGFRGWSGRSSSGGRSSGGRSSGGRSSGGRSSGRSSSGKARPFHSAVFHPVTDSNRPAPASSSHQTGSSWSFGSNKPTRYGLHGGPPRYGPYNAYHNPSITGHYNRPSVVVGNSFSSAYGDKGFHSSVESSLSSKSIFDSWFIGVTVAFAVFFVSIMVGWFVYNCLKEKKRRKAEKKLADSLDASAWDNQKQVCFSFSQAGTKHNLDKAVSETSDSDSDKYHKKGSVTSRDSSQSLDSPISSQSCLGDDESQFFAFQMDDSKPSEGASPKKHKEKSEWRRG